MLRRARSRCMEEFRRGLVGIDEKQCESLERNEMLIAQNSLMEDGVYWPSNRVRVVTEKAAFIIALPGDASPEAFTEFTFAMVKQAIREQIADKMLDLNGDIHLSFAHSMHMNGENHEIHEDNDLSDFSIDPAACELQENWLRMEVD